MYKTDPLFTPKIINQNMKIKIATFNVENLFERPKVFNFRDHSVGDQTMDKISKLRSILKEANYTDLRKRKILDLYNELKDYIKIREDRGKLFKRRGWSVIGVKADGAGSWDGTIEYKKAKYSEVARENTAKVIKKVKPHIACLVEADHRLALKAFDSQLSNNRFKYEMLIDGNDRRGIDVGIMSKYIFGNIKTHIYAKSGRSQIFSRDCLEVETIIDDNTSIHFLINHFKSKGYDADGRSDFKRERQAKKVKEILNNYDLDNDYVIVAGDLNDTPDSDPLKPLTRMNKLYDVLDLQFGNDMSKRWTYHYNDFEQIDYLLVSKALKNKFIDAGVERGGMYNLNQLTTHSNGAVEIEQQFESVTHWTNQASDHGAVWARFDL